MDTPIKYTDTRREHCCWAAAVLLQCRCGAAAVLLVLVLVLALVLVLVRVLVLVLVRVRVRVLVRVEPSTTTTSRTGANTGAARTTSTEWGQTRRRPMMLRPVPARAPRLSLSAARPSPLAAISRRYRCGEHGCHRAAGAVAPRAKALAELRRRHAERGPSRARRHSAAPCADIKWAVSVMEMAPTL